MSESNRQSVKLVRETTYNQAPASATWQAMRFNDINFAANPQTSESAEIRSDRYISDLILLGQQTGGSMDVSLSMGTYDDLFEAALCGTWTTDVLEVGQENDRSYVIEVGYEDWTPAQYLQYLGMRCAGFNFTFAWGAEVTGSFQFQGAAAAAPTTTSLVGAGSVTPVTTSDIVNGSSDISNVLIDGGAPGSIIRQIQLNLDNRMRPIEGVGSVGPSDQKYGSSGITGQIMGYFDDVTLYEKLLNNTSASLVFTVGDGTNTMTFDLPNVKFNDGSPQGSGKDSDVMLALNFTALEDAVKSPLRITRT